MLLYRIQHKDTSFGMWNTMSAEGRPLVTYLSNEFMATMPMPHSDVYGLHGRQWYSSASSLELLYFWFKPEDIQELIDMGFEVYLVEAQETQELENEVIFTRESVVFAEKITVQFVLVSA